MGSFIEKIRTYLYSSVSDVRIVHILIALAILFLFLLLKQFFSKIVLLYLKRLARKTKTTVDDELLDTLEAPLKFVIASMGFYFAFISLDLGSTYNILATKAFISAVIFAIGWALYKTDTLTSRFLEMFFEKHSFEVGLSFIPFFNKFIKFSIIVIAFVLIVQIWGYNIGAIITGLGIGGLAVALAAKDTLANMFGSLVILFDRPFRIGDWIKTSSTEGIVEDIGFRSTKIRTFENSLVSVPNSQIANEPVENFTLRQRRRIKFTIGVTYSTPREKIQEATNRIRAMLENHPGIYKGTLLVYFTEFADSSLNIFIYCFTTTIVWKEYLAIRQEINLNIISIMEDLGIEFAFPSMSIYIEKNDSSADKDKP